MNETDILQSIRLAVGSRYDCRIWRNNVGAFKDERGRVVQFGLCPGSSDLIGYRSVEITPDMVGKRVAVFAAIEVKAPKGHATPAQLAFLDKVKADGAIAGIARSANDAVALINSDTML